MPETGLTEIEITPVAPGELDRLAARAGAHQEAFANVRARLSRLFRLHAPEMPGLICFGAVIALDEGMARAHGASSLSATGTGLTPEAALAGCAAEAAELLSQFEAPGDLADEASTAPPLATGWIERSLASAPGPLDWISVGNIVSGDARLAPADLCLRRDPARRRLAPVGPLSAGCAAGRNLEDATARGLFELIERDAAALWWKGGRPAVPIGADHPCAAFAADLLQRLRPMHTRRTTILLDLTTDVGAPVIAAASHAPDGRDFACGLAARAQAADAAEAAIREMGQMELAAGVARIKLAEAGEAALGEADRRNLARAAFDARRCVLLRPSPRAPAHAVIDGGALSLARHLAAHGVATYRLDLTRANIGAPVARALAPALQPFSDAVATPRLAAAIARHGGAEFAGGMPLY